MGSKSDYLEKKLLNHALGGPDYSRPATVYVALYSVTPGDGGGGTEATGSGYARLAVTNNATNFPAASGDSPGTKANGTVFTFATPTGDWSGGADMVAFGIHDDPTAGNLLIWGALTVPKPALNGDPVFFPIGALTWTED